MSRIVEDLLGPESPLHYLLPGFQHRPSQMRLAMAIVDAYLNEQPLACEAPTASGKSFAYLSAAVEIVSTAKPSGEDPVRVVIGIANKSLQDQLATKDIPTIVRAVEGIRLGRRPRFTVVKGLANYLCLKRAEESFEELEMRRHHRTIEDLVEDMKGPWDGDFSTSRHEVDARLRRGLTVSSSDCSGRRCRYFKSCAGHRARDRAKTAEIVVTNFALLLEHLKVYRQKQRHTILGPFDAVIIDEAHLLPGAARSTFGYEFDEYAAGQLIDKIEHLAQGDPLVCRQMAPLRASVVQVLGPPRRKLMRTNSGMEPFQPDERYPADEFRAQACTLEGIVQRNKLHQGIGEQQDDYEGRVAEAKERVAALHDLARDAKTILEEPPDWFTRSIERVSKAHCRVSARPVRPGKYLRDSLWRIAPGATLLSATLRVGSSFDYICEETGMDPAKARWATVASPLDLKSQMCFVCPAEAVEGNDSRWKTVTPQLVRRVVEEARGGVLVLATSRAAVQAYAAALEGVPYNVYVQGDGRTPGDLARRFRDDRDSVLVGSRSFFEGLDVVGDSLRVTVIDKPMFATPVDPICLYMESKGINPFSNYSIPEAVLAFRQQVGRQIRSVTDRGVVVLLDRRFVTKWYRKDFFGAFEGLNVKTDISNSIETISQFLYGSDSSKS